MKKKVYRIMVQPNCGYDIETGKMEPGHQFPTDMLRSDCADAVDEYNSQLITDAVMGFWRAIELISTKITRERWESFGWIVSSVVEL